MTTHDDIRAATALLEAIVEDRGILAGVDHGLRTRLLTAAGRVSHPDKAAKRRLARRNQHLQKVEQRETDQSLLASTGIRRLRENPIFETPRRRGISTEAAESPGTLSEDQVCYTCRARFREVHFFYDQLCRTCGDFNFAKRSPSADLRGRTALVTGGRVKIGYHAAILMLRAGCKVVVTTRFPVDAAKRFAAEPDFSEWGARLQIHGIDLRHIPSVESLCHQLRNSLDRLDFIINNACQTVRRPPAFYAHMIEAEREGLKDSETRALVCSQTHGDAQTSAELTQLKLLAEDHLSEASLFPEGSLDPDLQQVDLRRVNSWRLQAHEVSTIELLEVHLVNAVAPFIINARLKALMLKNPGRDKHIVNVSAVEGQFYRTYKSDRHPHTNMAKASLNMLTRTSAADFVRDGIHMNSVDTGWITDEDPAHHAAEKVAMHHFHPPLDVVDGAARIVDPIFTGIATGEHVWGRFLKDYRTTDW